MQHHVDLIVSLSGGASHHPYSQQVLTNEYNREKGDYLAKPVNGWRLIENCLIALLAKKTP